MGVAVMAFLSSFPARAPSPPTLRGAAAARAANSKSDQAISEVDGWIPRAGALGSGEIGALAERPGLAAAVLRGRHPGPSLECAVEDADGLKTRVEGDC